MKNKLLLTVILAITLAFPLIACNNQPDEHLSYFETETFTATSFKEAVKRYGGDTYKNGEKTVYRLTDNQAKASYKNPTVKPLLTSKFNDECKDEEVHLRSLWRFFGEDLFAEDITYTVDSLVSTIKEYCVWSTSTHYLESEFDYPIANNPSVKTICMLYGAEFFNALNTKEYSFYVSDIIDLFKNTETWNTNCSIAYTSFGKTYPLAFYVDQWYNDNYRYYSSSECNEQSDLYPRIVDCIKLNLKDPDSYRADGNIDFYLREEPAIISGTYASFVYMKVPYRAKNGFGGYGNYVCWLTYNWRNNTVSWYNDTMPNGLDYTHVFKTCKVKKDLS